MQYSPLFTLAFTASLALTAGAAIDRQALVIRHAIEWNDPHGQVPLGNRGLLYAVAMMAAGWDQPSPAGFGSTGGRPHNHAPGFPDDDRWTVKGEELRKAP